MNPWRLREWLREEIERRRQEAEASPECLTSPTRAALAGEALSGPPGSASDTLPAARL
jgi:hypothetical protein